MRSSLWRERLARSGELRVRAGGLSMLPTLPPGAWLHVIPLAADDPRPGRIYLFQHGAGVRAHRLLEVGGAGLRLHGDNASADEWVPDPSALIGRVDAWFLLGLRVPLDSAGARVLAGLGGRALGLARAWLPRAWRVHLGARLRRRLEGGGLAVRR